MSAQNEQPKAKRQWGCWTWGVVILVGYVGSGVLVDTLFNAGIIPRGGGAERILETVYLPLFIIALFLGLVPWKWKLPCHPANSAIRLLC